MKAMILAAGRGERMRPLTDTIPKPLIEINGKPLIIWHIEKLVAAGFNQLVINISWLREQIKQRLGDGSNWNISIEYSEEDEALETAGGIIQALPLLGEKAFVVVNSDIWSDFPYASMRANLKELMASEFMAKLVLVKNPAHNPKGDFGLENQILQPYIASQNTKHWTFSGIAFYKPEFFSKLENGKQAIPPLWTAAAKEKKIAAEVYKGYWQDAGTPQRLVEIENHLEELKI